MKHPIYLAGPCRIEWLSALPRQCLLPNRRVCGQPFLIDDSVRQHRCKGSRNRCFRVGFDMRATHRCSGQPAQDFVKSGRIEGALSLRIRNKLHHRRKRCASRPLDVGFPSEESRELSFLAHGAGDRIAQRFSFVWNDFAGIRIDEIGLRETCNCKGTGMRLLGIEVLIEVFPETLGQRRVPGPDHQDEGSASRTDTRLQNVDDVRKVPFPGLGFVDIHCRIKQVQIQKQTPDTFEALLLKCVCGVEDDTQAGGPEALEYIEGNYSGKLSTARPARAI